MTEPTPAQSDGIAGGADAGATDADATGAGGVPGLAAAAVVAGSVFVAAGIPTAAARVDAYPFGATLVLLGPPPVLHLGVPLAALGVAYGGMSRLPLVSLNPVGLQRRLVVAGALVAGVGAATTAVFPVQYVFYLGRLPAAFVLVPHLTGWTLSAAGAGAAALSPAGDGTFRARVADRATAAATRVADATAGPVPAAVRWSVLAVGVLGAAAGTGVFVSVVTAPTTGGADGVAVAALASLYVAVWGGTLAAVGAALPDESRLPSPPAPQRTLVLVGGAVMALALIRVPVPGHLVPGGSLVRTGTAFVVAGLCWWAGAAVARRL